MAAKTQEDLGAYYIQDRANDDNYPRLDSVETFEHQRAMYKTEVLDVEQPPMQFSLAYPRPRKPLMADYHDCAHIVVSDKLKDVLAPKLSATTQFFPATIDIAKKTHPYWLMHPLRSHAVMNLERSKYDILVTGDVGWVNKLVINADALRKIPLADRLFFKLKEAPELHLWHESIVKAVEATQPQGIRFFRADNYGQDSLFTP